jgi:TRAP-type mannitol/chloroaromatic compound transport system permease small subunit
MSWLPTWLGRIDSLIGAVISAGSWLVLPLVLLLFLQWPLRDIVGAHSREANDLGQWIFALYVAISVTAATRQGTHLAADAVARRFSERRRAQLARIGTILGLMPWALFILVSSKSLVLSSVTLLESFPDTYNPGYFIIKLAVWVLALLMLAQAALTLLRPLERR